MTVLSRIESKAKFPSFVTVIRVDPTSLESLTAALRDQDAVISAVGIDGLLGQRILFDASIAAGVKRFLPSEFGCDLSNTKTANLPVFSHNIAIRKYIEEKVKEGADITYTYLVTGAFLDWGLERGFLLEWKEGTPRIYNGGDVHFSVTTLASLGLATVGVLSYYEETRNRQVEVQDLAITQNRLLELARTIALDKKWNPVAFETSEMLGAANASLVKGDFSVMYDYILVALFSVGYNGLLQNTENEFLGVAGKTEEDVESILRRVLACLTSRTDKDTE